MTSTLITERVGIQDSNRHIADRGDERFLFNLVPIVSGSLGPILAAKVPKANRSRSEKLFPGELQDVWLHVPFILQGDWRSCSSI